MTCCTCNGLEELRNSEDVKSGVELLDKVLDELKDEPGSLVSIMQKAQDIYGYLPTDVMFYISKVTGIKPAKVLGVATFYTQFRLAPVGKHLIMVCQGTACHVNGSALIEDAIKDELGITEGETTEDGMFTYNNMACLGCCSLAPVIMIGDETYGKLTGDKVRQVIREIQKKEEAQ